MNNRPKILVVGSLVMDLIVGMDRFPLTGETVLGTFFKTATGGKGANQAVQSARLGADVTMVGKVGDDDFGKQLIRAVSECGVDTTKIKTSKTSSTAIGNIQIESKNGKADNRICVVSGANMDISPEDILFLEKEIANYDMVLLQFEIPMEINMKVAEYAAKKGVPVMLNTAPYAPIPKEMLHLLTFVSPNESEAAAISGIEIKDVKSADKAIRAIAAMGIKNVIITLGSRGAIIGNKNGSTFFPSVEGVTAVDPTAAGDSFVGAFCTAICSGYDQSSAMEFANATAAITVSRMGAMPSLPTLKEVKKLQEKIKNEKNT